MKEKNARDEGNERKIAIRLDNNTPQSAMSFIDGPQTLDISQGTASAHLPRPNSTESNELTQVKNSPEIRKSIETQELKEKIIAALQEIYDPEIPVNIYDLGLIYSVEIDAAFQVTIQMTLTSPMCPVAQTFPQTVQDRILQVKGVGSVTVDLVWEPPWTKDNMSEAVRLQLNLF